MERELRKKGTRLLSVLFAIALILQAPLLSFAESSDNNESPAGNIDPGETVEYNADDIVENNGTVNENAGAIDTNNGVVEDNAGTIEQNNGTVNTNTGTVNENNGTIVTNSGEINENEGSVTENTEDGTINENEGDVKKNSGTINWNEGYVEENYGYVNNRGNGDDYGGVQVVLEEELVVGVVEKNYGTVYNSGVVKLNKGTVFNNGGKVEKDLGKHYFRVWLSLPSNIPDSAWSYTVDKGFISYMDFDRWLEKNDVGQLTFKLKKGYGWKYDLGAPTDPNGYRAYFNPDGSMTIIVDRMHEWMRNVALEIPLTKISYGGSKQLKPIVIMHTVAFDLDGGAFNKGTDEEESGIVERAFEDGMELVFSEIPEKDGYVFKYWEEVIPEEDKVITDSEDSEGESEEQEPPRYKEKDKYVVTKDVTFKAVWEKSE